MELDSCMATHKISVIAKLNHPLFKQKKPLPPYIDLKVELTRNKKEIYLNKLEGDDDFSVCFEAMKKCARKEFWEMRELMR